jgi:hypothetical protein
MADAYFVALSCDGERCGFEETISSNVVILCDQPAEHKVEETIFRDDPVQERHPLTCYLCHKHFRALMGPMTERVRPLQTAVQQGTRRQPHD